jgi:hypothetical protein
LPELLKEYRGKWVAIVNEQLAVVNVSPSAVLDKVYERLGDVPVYVQQVLEKQLDDPGLALEIFSPA